MIKYTQRGENRSTCIKKATSRSGTKKTPKNKTAPVRKARTEPRHGAAG